MAPVAKVSAATTTVKPGTPDVTYTYRPSGAVASRLFSGGTTVPLTYTIREQLAKIGDPATTTSPFSAGYSYNANGTISSGDFYSAGSPAATKRYKYDFPTYDALNRLKSADHSSWNGAAWTSTLAYDLAGINYDKSGNLTALQRYRETATLVDNLTYTIAGSSNRLTTLADAVGVSAELWDAEAGSFTYDANGNQLTAPAPYSLTASTYDVQNLPLSLTRSGVTTTYRYNEIGQRIAKQVGAGNTEVYLLEDRVPLGVYSVNGAGTVVSSYFNLLADTRVVGRLPSGGTRSYYHTDLLGSTRAVVQGATVTESYDYDPWGVLLPGRTLGSGTKEQFTTKERDAESALDYFGARSYASALGRWTTVDPAGAADSLPQWSSYTYVKNNPALYFDPQGLRIVFEGERANELRAAWNYAKAVLKSAAREGDRLAGSALSLIRAAENSKVVLTFRSATPTQGFAGETTPQSGFREMIIDLGRVEHNLDRYRDQILMLHEFGHASAHNILENPLQSTPQAMAMENIMRAAMGFENRENHEGNWPRLRRRGTP